MGCATDFAGQPVPSQVMGRLINKGFGAFAAHGPAHPQSCFGYGCPVQVLLVRRKDMFQAQCLTSNSELSA
eukprot:12765649-Alexandrium_andersonii.AAC.1